ncbi:MAG: glycosyltransferase family 4 protein [Anaerolineae bacterium]
MRVAINGLFWNQAATGSGQYVRELVAAMARMDDIRLTLVVDAPLRTPPPADTEIRQAGMGASTNLGKLWFEQVAFPAACRRTGVDVAHVPYFAPLTGFSPVVVTIHDLIPLLLPEYRGGWHVRAYMALAARAARRANLIITDSETSAQDVEQVLGIPRDRVRVVHLAAATMYRTCPAEKVLETRERLALPEQYLLYVGGFDRRKSVPEMLQAYRQALPTLHGVPLVIGGRLPGSDTAFAPDPRRVARELGLSNHVRFLGRLSASDMPALYAGAMALVYPSRYEGFGLPPLEAISCGTPVIATRASSLPEVVGEGGILVPPGDGAALSDAMCALVEDAALRERLSERGLEQAARFSWERTARETVAVYREALAGA